MQLIWPWQDRTHGFSWLKAITFALMFAPGIWLEYQYASGEFGPVPMGGMTYWSGYWATALLLLALAVTPMLAIFRLRHLVIVRRMIGVAALLYTIAHIIIYFALRLWNFPGILNEMITRVSLIVATISTLGLLVLGATSLDAAVARMGAPGWQRLHDIVYLTTGLAIVHYLMSPGIFPDQYLMSGIFFWLMAWRWLNRRRLGADAKTLAVLAIISSLFTASLEAGWIWVRHGYEPLDTLANNFSLVLGVAPAWQVLGLGLAVALLAAIMPAPRLQRS